jgi:hypothetical protein
MKTPEIDLIAVMGPGQLKIMQATIEDRFYRIAKANHRLQSAYESSPMDTSDDELERKQAIIRIDLEIPKAIEISNDGAFLPPALRSAFSCLGQWIRGKMEVGEIEEWFFFLTEFSDLDCGWIFFDEPNNYYQRDPSREFIPEETVLEWMIAVGSRKVK